MATRAAAASAGRTVSPMDKSARPEMANVAHAHFLYRQVPRPSRYSGLPAVAAAYLLGKVVALDHPYPPLGRPGNTPDADAPYIVVVVDGEISNCTGRPCPFGAGTYFRMASNRASRFFCGLSISVVAVPRQADIQGWGGTGFQVSVQVG